MVFRVDFNERNFLLTLDRIACYKVNNNINKGLRILENVGDNLVKKLGFVGNRIGKVIAEDIAQQLRNCCVFLDKGYKEHKNFRAAYPDLTVFVNCNKIITVGDRVTESSNRLEEIPEHACAKLSCLGEQLVLLLLGDAFLRGGIDLFLCLALLGLIKEVADTEAVLGLLFFICQSLAFIRRSKNSGKVELE